MELIGPYLVACGLLMIAGVMKAISPDDTARALASATPPRFLQFRSLRVLIRAGALAEVILGGVAMILPRPLSAALVAGSYAVFVLVVVYVRSRGGALASCGCFGSLDTPATRLHLVVNLGLGLAGVAVAVDAPSTGTTINVLAGQPLYGLPFTAVGLLCLWLTFLALSSWSQLQAARRLAGSPTGKWR